MIDDEQDDDAKPAIRQSRDWHGPYDEPGLPQGFERLASGEIRPTLETEFLSRTPPKQQVNLQNNPHLWTIAASHYARTGRHSASAAAVGVTTSTLRKLLKSNQDFADLMTEAHETYRSRIQAEFQRRAYDGVTKPIMHKGEIAATTQEYNDSFLLIELRRVDPEYRELLASPKAGQTTVNVHASAHAAAGAQATALESLERAALSPLERQALRALVSRRPEASNLLPEASGLPQEPSFQVSAAPGRGSSLGHPSTSGETLAIPAPGSLEPGVGSAEYAVPSHEPAARTTEPAVPSTEPAVPSTDHEPE